MFFYSGWNLSLFNSLLHVLILRNQTSEVLLQTYHKLRSPAENLLLAECRKRKWKISQNTILPKMCSCFETLQFLDQDHIIWFSQHGLKGWWEFEIQLPSCCLREMDSMYMGLELKVGVWLLLLTTQIIMTDNFLNVYFPSLLFVFYLYYYLGQDSIVFHLDHHSDLQLVPLAPISPSPVYHISWSHIKIWSSKVLNQNPSMTSHYPEGKVHIL